MKPHYFIESVLKQLEVFNVSTVGFELHVGGDGMVGTGDSILSFSVDMAEFRVRREEELNEKMNALLDVDEGGTQE